MALTNSFGSVLRRRIPSTGVSPMAGVVGAMTGNNPVFTPALTSQPVAPPVQAFAPTPTRSAPLPSLPANPGFNDLADYEEKRRTAFGNRAEQDILGYGDKVSGLGTSLLDTLKKNTGDRTGAVGSYVSDFGTRSAARRAELSKTLTDLGQKQFELANPFILEDLNKRGVFSSPTAIGNEQSRALKEIALDNQRQLMQREAEDIATEERLRQMGLDETLAGSREGSTVSRDLFGRNTDIMGTALTARLQGEQDAMDAGLDLRRGKLEADIAAAEANREEALARDLAKEQGRNNLTNSLIGAGGSILGGSIASGGGLLGGLFGGGGTAAATGAGAGGVPLAGAGGTAAGGAGVGTALAVPAAGYAAMELSRAAEEKAGDIGGIVANPIGYQLNKAKEFAKDPKKFVQDLGSKISSSISGHKSGSTGSGQATAQEQTRLDSELEDLRQLRDAMRRGELSREEYFAIAQPKVDEITQRVGHLAGKGKKWADAINPNFRRFLTEGVIDGDNGQWTASV